MFNVKHAFIKCKLSQLLVIRWVASPFLPPSSFHLETLTHHLNIFTYSLAYSRRSQGTDQIFLILISSNYLCLVKKKKYALTENFSGFQSALRTICEERKDDCCVVIPLKFTYIYKTWRRLCKEDKINAWMPHKITSAIEIRAFNQWQTSFTEGIRSQWLEGKCAKPMYDCYLPLQNNDSHILHFDRYFDQKFLNP